ncbi:DUF4363 family protein [Dethiobacter alkaliphilus]|uniref:DUF4363 family protein n=1 Tax=Dethiobacter alkaliphilus TaxID=427926 RepID=UPI002227EB8E|nr:DUF4363 family protein [Dethiobacter alkaliphilus]MCW3490927.1 DUF4363 family protein [Dethiobacter alkaliphilus]
MIKRIMAYSLPVILIMSFVYVLTSGESQKKPKAENDNVSALFLQLEKQVAAEEWEKAGETLSNLETAVGKVVPRVQYSVGRDDIINLERNLARVRGYVGAQEKAGALSELAEASYFWHILGK